MLDRQVTLPEGYFSQAKNEYANWKQAWWREAFQNAFDATATKIELAAIMGDDERITLSCYDNGCGMSYETLTSVFLAMGGTNKGEESCGGFGYAKVILLFAQEEFSIETGHHRIIGRSGSYRYEESDMFLEGTRITAVMSKRDSISVNNMVHQLEHWIHFSNLPSSLDVTINGDKVKLDSGNMDYHVETDLGKLSFREEGSSYSRSTLWVRIKGLCMFSHNIYHQDGQASFTGVLDLDLPSKDVLTSNRDGLKGEFARKLDNIVNKLSTERSNLKCEELISMTLNASQSIDEYEEMVSSSLMSSARSSRAMAEDDGIDTDNVFKKLKEKADSVEDRVKERFGKIDSSGYPTNFKIRTHKLRNGDPRKRYFDIARRLELKRVQKMAWNWNTIVNELLKTDWAVSIGVTWRGQTPFLAGRPIYNGFIFSDDAEGLEVSSDEEYQILVNKDLLPKDLDFEDILDVAIHEVTHLAIHGHCDIFSRYEMDLRRSQRRHMKAREIEKLSISRIKRYV